MKPWSRDPKKSAEENFADCLNWVLGVLASLHDRLDRQERYAAAVYAMLYRAGFRADDQSSPQQHQHPAPAATSRRKREDISKALDTAMFLREVLRKVLG